MRARTALITTLLFVAGLGVNSCFTLAEPVDQQTSSTTSTTAAATSTTSGPTTTTTTSTTSTTAGGSGLNTNNPASIVKLCFIHHSCGEYWLESAGTYPGGLGATLNSNNYYVTETYYGWNAEPGDGLGDNTDTVDWPTWFTDAKMPFVFTNEAHYAHVNSIADPGGENEIIMFKSCYPNSEVGGSIADEQAVYNGLLAYFAAHTDKLFILVTPPGEEVVTSHVLTRQLGDWLVDESGGWLSGYPHNNVGVFDFYCVLSETDSHHRINGGVIQREFAAGYDGISPYHDGDDHPNSAGNTKATLEFLPLLNHYYNRWKGL